MLQNFLAAITVLGGIIVFFGGGVIGTLLAKHRINAKSVVGKAANTVSVFSKVESVAAEFLPEPYKGEANFLTSTAKKCVEVAEEACNAGQYAPNLRKAKATELINSALEMEKIPQTDRLKKAVSLVIDLAATLFVPHKSETVKAAKDTTANNTAGQAVTGATKQ